jgi:hypothetical protein
MRDQINAAADEQNRGNSPKNKYRHDVFLLSNALQVKREK